MPAAAVAAALAAAADHGGGHGPGPDCEGADVRRRVRLDLSWRRAQADVGGVAEQGAGRPVEDPLAGVDHGRPAGRGRWRPLSAGAELRLRRGAGARAADGPTTGQAPAYQR